MHKFDTTVWLIGIVFLVLLIFIGLGEINQKNRFMADCKQHKPEYECTVL